ncbi:hypothetical protein LMG28727_00916 [Paraburkholderia kirstenboschensis]|nr:hypothetical protein LMG28727_00916 [Paraburkholderia kirstenboschensis]
MYAAIEETSGRGTCENAAVRGTNSTVIRITRSTVSRSPSP